MLKRSTAILMAGAVATAGLLAGCENIPVSKGGQGAVIGGVGGAGVGAAVARNEPVLGALIGSAVGAGGGYLIGSQLDKADQQHREEMIRASEQARLHPVTPAQALQTNSADINGDGYVTLDEVAAMSQAGLSDQEIISRLRRSGAFFELSPSQEAYLRNQGVSERVISAMQSINSNLHQEAYDRMHQAPPPPPASPPPQPQGPSYPPRGY